MQNTHSASLRLEASIRALDERMRGAAGDLDYETCLHEKRTLMTALHALREKRAREEAGTGFS